MIVRYTVYNVMSNRVLVDTFSTLTYGNDEAAIRAARASRDRYNVSEYVLVKGGTPAQIIRAFRSKTVKDL